MISQLRFSDKKRARRNAIRFRAIDILIFREINHRGALKSRETIGARSINYAKYNNK